MEIILENLSLVLLFVILIITVVLITQSIRKRELIEEANNKITVLRSRLDSVKEELSLANEIQIKTNKELKEAYTQIETQRQLAKQNNKTPKGYTSAELRDKLRFLLPNNEVAKNVKVKIVGHKLSATVRKKVSGGKFADVSVTPVIVD